MSASSMGSIRHVARPTLDCRVLSVIPDRSQQVRHMVVEESIADVAPVAAGGG